MKRTISVELSDKEAFGISEYLQGKISSRELGKILNMSHQGSINLFGTIIKQWYRDGVIKFSEITKVKKAGAKKLK